jgi:type IV secretory pathway TrbL component
MASNPDPGAGGRAARCAAACKDLDNDHAAAAARAQRAMIGRGVRIGGVVRCRRIDPRHWGGDQLLGTRNVGLAAGAGEQPVVADAMKPLRQNVEQEAPDELVSAERHGPN